VSANDLATIVVVILAFFAFVVVLLAMQSLVRSLRDLRTSLDTLHDQTVPLIEELRATVRDAGAEVDRVDQLLDAAESISSTVDSATRLSYLAFRAPMLRFVAFFKGVGRFVGRLFGRRTTTGGRSGRSGAGRRRAA
jgi:predicted PurR-regulated permease PerM